MSNAIGAASWSSVASSSDGFRLYAMSVFQRLYRSADSGATWITNTSPFFFDPISVASSADGRVVIIGNNGGRIAVSTNSGFTWTVTNMISSFGNVPSLSASATGQRLSACGAPGRPGVTGR